MLEWIKLFLNCVKRDDLEQVRAGGIGALDFNIENYGPLNCIGTKKPATNIINIVYAEAVMLLVCLTYF